MTIKSKKDIFLKVRISQEDKIIIQQKAEESGMTVSDFFRQTTLGYRVRNNQAQKEAFCNLARLASNLNQIARQVNTHKNNLNKIQLLTSLLEIESHIGELRKCI